MMLHIVVGQDPLDRRTGHITVMDVEGVERAEELRYPSTSCRWGYRRRRSS